VTDEEVRRLGDAIGAGIVKALVSAIQAKPTPSAPVLPASTEEPRWMRINDYAKKRGFARSTIQQWITEGMPSAPMGRGYRVDVRAADAWLERGGAAMRHRGDA